MTYVEEQKAYAKLNIYLDITGVREDGYHDIQTIMQQIDLADDIIVRVDDKSDYIRISTDSDKIPTDKNNIAWKAAKLFLKTIQKTAGVEIEIIKRIPLDAGLGGSSADGAAVLLALNRIYGYPFSVSQLCTMGESLGADVAFCIVGGTALCLGIGGDLHPLPSVPDCAFVVIKPPFGYSTMAAYHLYDEMPILQHSGIRALERSIREGKLEIGARLMYNIFEDLYSDSKIEEIKDALRDVGALGAMLTGSGSAVFGVFPSVADAEEAFGKLEYPEKYVCLPKESNVFDVSGENT